MKRTLAAAAALLCACTESTSTANADLASPSALAVVGRNLLVANTNGADLRVLALDPGGRKFVRAPNPIFPLSVPTAPYPQALGGYTATDGQTTPPFAFALSTAAAQVSVIASYDLTLLGSFAAPGVPLALAVTAPQPGVATRLVVSSTQGELGALYTASFLPSQVADPSGIAQTQLQLAVSLGRSQPQALAVSRDEPDLVIVGDRLDGDDGMGRRGGLALVDLRTGAVERFEVGGGVSALSLAPSDSEAGRGERLFGVLDPQGCESEVCGGLFAFDLGTRSLLPAAGVGPIEIPGLARGVAAGGTSTVNTGKETLQVSPLVMVSSANGQTYLVDGGLGRVIDVGGAEPSVTKSERIEPSGTAAEPLNGPVDVQLARGAARSETVSVTWEGALPGLTRTAGALAGSELTGAADFAAAGATAGDVVVFEGVAGCEAPIAAVSSQALTLGALSAAGCAPAAPTFTVRVGNAFAVTGSVSGWMGRAVPGAPFTFQGRYFHAADGYDPSRPAVRFTMGSGEPRLRDARYSLEIASGVTPFGVPISTLHMPGAVAHDRKLDLFFVVYQGGSRVVELAPADVRPGDASSGLRTYR